MRSFMAIADHDAPPFHRHHLQIAISIPFNRSDSTRSDIQLNYYATHFLRRIAGLPNDAASGSHPKTGEPIDVITCACVRDARASSSSSLLLFVTAVVLVWYYCSCSC